MKVVRTANGKQTIKMSRNEWKNIGKKGGWMKKMALYTRTITDEEIKELVVNILLEFWQEYGKISSTQDLLKILTWSLEEIFSDQVVSKYSHEIDQNAFDYYKFTFPITQIDEKLKTAIYDETKEVAVAIDSDTEYSIDDGEYY